MIYLLVSLHIASDFNIQVVCKGILFTLPGREK